MPPSYHWSETDTSLNPAKDQNHGANRNAETSGRSQGQGNPTVHQQPVGRSRRRRDVRHLQSRRPARCIAKVAEGDTADVDLAVKAARKALESGPVAKMDAADRGRLLFKLADLVEKNAEELAALESLNCGKTITDSRGDMQGVVNTLRYYAGWADKIEGQTVPVRGNFLSLHAAAAGRRRRPDHSLELPAADAGVEVGPGPGLRQHRRHEAGRADAADGPARRRAGPWKPASPTASSTSSTARRDGRRRHGGTSGRRQDRLHRPRRYGQDHPEGAPPTRSSGPRSSWAARARTSSSPTPTWTQAVAGAFHAIYFHGGQCCTAGSRLFVEEKIHQEFVERLAEKAKERKVGDPLDPTTEQGPQVSQEQMDKILGYIEAGPEAGRQAR